MLSKIELRTRNQESQILNPNHFMALILNIETATDICSVALADENGLIDFRENDEGRSHASLLTVLTGELLKKNGILVSNLNAVAVSMGPGSYTGLRIGVSVAKGLCFGSDKPLIAVPTLESMWNGIISAIKEKKDHTYNDAWFCPMLDAKRQEVYLAFFDKLGNVKVNTSAVILTENSFEEILSDRKVFFFGTGSKKFSELINHPNALFINDYKNSAKNMVNLSQKFYTLNKFQDLAYFEPFYLKEFIATVAKDKVLKK